MKKKKNNKKKMVRTNTSPRPNCVIEARQHRSANKGEASAASPGKERHTKRRVVCVCPLPPPRTMAIIDRPFLLLLLPPTPQFPLRPPGAAAAPGAPTQSGSERGAGATGPERDQGRAGRPRRPRTPATPPRPRGQRTPAGGARRGAGPPHGVNCATTECATTGRAGGGKVGVTAGEIATRPLGSEERSPTRRFPTIPAALPAPRASAERLLRVTERPFRFSSLTCWSRLRAFSTAT